MSEGNNDLLDVIYVLDVKVIIHDTIHDGIHDVCIM
jgi:hypothetical protein